MVHRLSEGQILLVYIEKGRFHETFIDDKSSYIQSKYSLFNVKFIFLRRTMYTAPEYRQHFSFMMNHLQKTLQRNLCQLQLIHVFSQAYRGKLGSFSCARLCSYSINESIYL